MEENNSEKIYYIPVEDILPNRFQPRLAFDEKELNNLADSIIKYGVIQPIVLRKISDKYEIIAGERRYKAACLAGLKKIPAIINNTDDNTSAEIALLENLQRKNLTVIEEAQSYKKLIDKGFTQEDIANKLSVSQSSIANKLRLLNLPKEVRDALLYNKISERHARTLLSLENEDLQKSLLNKIIEERLTVKQTEDEVSMLIMKKDFNRNNVELPEEIKRFLNPAPVDNNVGNKEIVNESKPNIVENNNISESNKVDEILNFNIPHVISIQTEQSENSVNNNQSLFKETISYDESINPFQIPGETINDINLNYSDSNETNQKSQEKPKENNYEKNKSKVKEIIKNINKIDGVITKEEDLGDKYQIIIEIDKSTN